MCAIQQRREQHFRMRPLCCLSLNTDPQLTQAKVTQVSHSFAAPELGWKMPEHRSHLDHWRQYGIRVSEMRCGLSRQN